MIGSRRAAITASVIGALLVAGAPTFAFGDADATHEAKAYSAASTSDEMTAQKAKDADDKKADDKKADDKKAADKKKDADDNKKSDSKKSDDNRKKDSDDKKAADRKKDADDKKKSDDNKKKDADDRQASDHQRHDNGRRDEAKKDDRHDGDHHDGDWKDRRHDDKWDRDWDHNRDRDHHRHDWDTHRRYYRYGYYGPGYYDDCGYYGPGYDGNGRDYAYYGPDACGYEYGGYRSHFLVDMSGDEVVPERGPRDAVGTANLDIDVAAGTVCFRLAYDGIDRAVGAQIHPGRRGETGPSQVLLHVGDNGDDGCVGADPRILSEIQNDPRGYYLEVDDAQGPVMRGQLDAPDYRNRY